MMYQPVALAASKVENILLLNHFWIFLSMFVSCKSNKIMEKKQPIQRLQSLDTLRGFDMFFIMGGGSLFVALATIFPNVFFQTIAKQMEHVPWNGFAFEDMIFPLFLFIAGISFPYSFAKQREKSLSGAAVYKKIVRRGLTLVILGFVYNGLLQLDFEHQRYASVLGRIGLAWMFAALIFIKTSAKTRLGIIAAILLVYWLLLAFIPAPDGGGAGVFTKEGSLVGYIDRMFLPGRLHLGIHDPEGLLATIPAIATALLGMSTGEFIKSGKFGLSDTRKVLYILLAGIVLLVIGKVWNIVFPINKNLWTSSFVCFVGGISAILFALFYYLVDVKNYKKWTLFFRVIGMNSITIYLAQRFINFRYTADSLFGGLISLVPENMQPLISSLAYIAVCWGFLYILYRQRIFLKV